MVPPVQRHCRASTIAQDLLEISRNLQIKGWLRWCSARLPGIASYAISRALTTRGGAWNATIAVNTEAGDVARIVLAPDPGRIQADIPITLPHPRDRRLSAPFSEAVEMVYAILTARPSVAARTAEPPIARHIRHVPVNVMAGLFVTVAAAPSTDPA